MDAVTKATANASHRNVTHPP
ncbi:MAG: hypothetical protein RL153_2175, partial [Verrucomicrobiota bacterium]